MFITDLQTYNHKLQLVSWPHALFLCYSQYTAESIMGERLAVIEATDPVSCSPFLFVFIHNLIVGAIYVLLIILPLSFLPKVNNHLQLQGLPLHFLRGKTCREEKNGKKKMTSPGCCSPSCSIQIKMYNFPACANAPGHYLPNKMWLALAA